MCGRQALLLCATIPFCRHCEKADCVRHVQDGSDDIDISKCDVALITHFHLDHCAAVPYLLTKTRFKVRSLI